MGILVERFVEAGNAFDFDGKWVENNGAVRAKGTIRQGMDWSQVVDIPVDLGGRDIEELNEAEIEGAVAEAIVNWIKARGL